MRVRYTEALRVLDGMTSIRTRLAIVTLDRDMEASICQTMLVVRGMQEEVLLRETATKEEMKTLAIGVGVWRENLEVAVVEDASVQVAVSVVPPVVVLVGAVEDVVAVMEGEWEVDVVVAVVVEVVAGVDVVGIKTAKKAIIYFPDKWL